MASGNQASDGKGQAGGYQIGELDLGPKPKARSSAAEPAAQPARRASQAGVPAIEPTSHSRVDLEPVKAQGALAAPPANQQKPREKGLGRATNVLEDEPEAPALELELDVPRPAKKSAQAMAPVKAQPKPAPAKSSQPSEAQAFGGKDLGDGFGEPETGPDLEVEKVLKNEGRVVAKGPDPKLEAAKEEASVRELAGFGDRPENLGESVRYAIHVVKRLMVLKREREKAQNDAQGLEADHQTALVEMGQALFAMGTDAKLSPLRRSLAAVHDANAKVTSAEQTVSKAKEENLRAVEKMERECQDMRTALKPYLDGEADADARHKKAEEELKRAEALLKRVEIEQRALTDSKTADPARLSVVQAQFQEKSQAVGDAQAKIELAAMALGNARRELAMRRGTLDAHEEKKKALIEDIKRREAEVEQHAKAAEGGHAVALRALAQACIDQKLQELTPERFAWVQEVGGAHDAAKRVVARYDRALTMYERPEVIKGFAVVAGLIGLLGVAIAIALG